MYMCIMYVHVMYIYMYIVGGLSSIFDFCHPRKCCSLHFLTESTSLT